MHKKIIKVNYSSFYIFLMDYFIAFFGYSESLNLTYQNIS